MHKSLLPFVLSAVLLIGAGCAKTTPSAQNPVIVPEVVSNTNSNAPTPDANANLNSNTNSNTNGNVNSPTNTNAPAGSSDTEKKYTMAEVATHNSEASCWSAIRGKVYDLTSWIGQHPGGAQNIKKLCGTDGTDFFVGQHAGSPPQENRLAGFEIGTVK